MATSCPSCGAPAQSDARFCDDCGTRLGAEVAAAAPDPALANLPPLPSLPNLEPLSSEPSQLGSELIVEVETNRPMVHGHALMLRFRATSNFRSPCGVTLCMKLHGRGRHIEQDDDDLEQRCQLHRRGDQHVFSFPFLSLRPGYIVVQELLVVLTPLENPSKTITYELPDQSLFVDVSGPSVVAGPGAVISGGIHIDFSKLEEVYGADIKNLLNLNATREAEPGRPVIAWQPIGLRLLPASPLPTELRLSLPGGVALELVRIRAGEFQMGSPEEQGKDDERPQHPVRITRDFYLGRFPVTQEQYQALTGSNPSHFAVTERHPVDTVSWIEAREFCRRLRAFLQTQPASGQTPLPITAVSLPTEAEWEYACRSGTPTMFSFGDNLKDLPEYGWFDKNSEKTTQAVGQLRPNAWGLYDMHGNVWEWCEDAYFESYAGSAVNGHVDQPAGDRRVLRGGSWSCSSRQCRSACRHAVEPSAKTANYGFRVVIGARAETE